MIERILKHDKYLQQLSDRISPQYDLVSRHVPLYSPRKRLVGEVDLIAFKGGVCDIYEVKCSHRIAKARRQLTKFKKHVSAFSRVRHSYFFCGESGILIHV